MNKKFICIEGNIGAGKTTLAHLLSERYQAKLLLENFEDNPYLKDFYLNSEKFALQVELSFLADRFNEQLSLRTEKGIIVSDYLFDKSFIFAGINLKKESISLFTAAFYEAKKQLREPDILIFLDATEDLLERNIKKRGRNFEENIPTAYLQKVTNAYHSYFKHHELRCPVIWVNANEYDLIGNKGHLKRLEDLLLNVNEKEIHYL
jgi:deoxyguanosine kinase